MGTMLASLDPSTGNALQAIVDAERPEPSIAAEDTTTPISIPTSPELRNLAVLFETAASCKEEMSGLEHLMHSIEVMGTRLLSEAEAQPESETPSKVSDPPTAGNVVVDVAEESAGDWYAMDLIWTIASSKIEEGKDNTPSGAADWSALASVMSLIKKESP